MVVPDDAKNRILLKATNIDEAIGKLKNIINVKKSLRVYTIKPPVSLLWGTIRKPGVYRVEKLYRKKTEAASASRAIEYSRNYRRIDKSKGSR